MEATFTTDTLAQFCEKLASGSSVPGGGAAAGLSGAMGMALASMCANLTLGRPKYSQWEDGAKAAAEAALPVMRRMLAGMDADAAAFSAYMDALALPKDNEAEKQVRQEAIRSAVKIATEVPLALLGDCEEALFILESLVEKSNPTCASDLGASALQIKAAAQMAELNVHINLKAQKDPELREKYRAECELRMDSIRQKADGVHARILELYQT